MKYVILIHANPEPWGHPTSIYSAEAKAIPQEQHDEMARDFDALLTEISESGEFVVAEALADPSSATLYGWSPQGYLATEGPYAEAKEHLAGFFMIDCETRERAEQIAARFAQPGGVVELRPAMWPGGDDR
ncbi:YciI family protein [Angustibacter sp. McL0619]|uniref:YciI family protein n=1 Tax=Angustibacter sp. McL0619 TaxID=3415676 RepID=UPI003CEA3E6B